MAGMTNKGKARIYNGFFRNTSVPTNLYIALITAATAPTAGRSDGSLGIGSLKEQQS